MADGTDPRWAWVLEFVRSEQAPDHVDAWVQRTHDAIRAEVPDIATDDALVERGIREHWLAFLDHLVGDGPVVFVPAAQELAVTLARRHGDLSVLFKIYRVAQQASWSYATEVVASAPDGLDHGGILVEFWSAAATWLDNAIEESTLLHQRETRRVQQRGDAQRYDVVRGVLAGEHHEPRELSAALGGYPLTTGHVALVLTALTPDAIAVLEPTALRLATTLGSGRPLVVKPGGRELWCWVPVTAPPGPLAVEVDTAAVRVTLGGPHDGVDGFVAAHADARAAQRVALESRRPRSVTAYDDVAALALLATDPEGARRFTERTLRGLAAPEAERLRETVRTVLATPGGMEGAGRTLGIHKNTVRYRVGQAEKLLGHGLLERVRDLALALDYYETFLAPVP
jgi:hypothetical protein